MEPPPGTREWYEEAARIHQQAFEAVSQRDEQAKAARYREWAERAQRLATVKPSAEQLGYAHNPARLRAVHRPLAGKR